MSVAGEPRDDIADDNLVRRRLLATFSSLPSPCLRRRGKEGSIDDFSSSTMLPGLLIHAGRRKRGFFYLRREKKKR
ncbi:hypothetical protein BHE74_00053141 [Ensete ventricosum]|nr:hypothetical protein BHE74_00053141 [Ensete ventricosum]